MVEWLLSWWWTFLYGSVFTRHGRALRAALRDPDCYYVEAERPE